MLQRLQLLFLPALLVAGRQALHRGCWGGRSRLRLGARERLCLSGTLSVPNSTSSSCSSRSRCAFPGAPSRLHRARSAAQALSALVSGERAT